jgi:pyruvate formate lyase activating enzyme
MPIAGLQKNSFVDYPGKIAAVVFYGGCNFNCWYCHNRHILGDDYPRTDEKEVLDFLEKRRGMLDAAVFSGGEATLQRGLIPLMERVKAMGYLIKLDTNGTRPGIIERCLERGLTDYIAMDIKAPLGKYGENVCAPYNAGAIKRSIGLIMRGRARYEFRTTCVPQLTADDIETIAHGMIAGAGVYALQQYRHRDTGGVIAALKLPPRDRAFFEEASRRAAPYVDEVILRGV